MITKYPFRVTYDEHNSRRTVSHETLILAMMCFVKMKQRQTVRSIEVTVTIEEWSRSSENGSGGHQ